MCVCMYTNLYVVKYSLDTHSNYAVVTNIGYCALWSCARMNIRDTRKPPAMPIVMHKVYSMHAAVERLFTNTGYK